MPQTHAMTQSKRGQRNSRHLASPPGEKRHSGVRCPGNGGSGADLPSPYSANASPTDYLHDRALFPSQPKRLSAVEAGSTNALCHHTDSIAASSLVGRLTSAVPLADEEDLSPGASPQHRGVYPPPHGHRPPPHGPRPPTEGSNDLGWKPEPELLASPERLQVRLPHRYCNPRLSFWLS